jgi:hypothetical protein
VRAAYLGKKGFGYLGPHLGRDNRVEANLDAYGAFALPKVNVTSWAHIDSELISEEMPVRPQAGCLLNELKAKRTSAEVRG